MSCWVRRSHSSLPIYVTTSFRSLESSYQLKQSWSFWTRIHRAVIRGVANREGSSGIAPQYRGCSALTLDAGNFAAVHFASAPWALASGCVEVLQRSPTRQLNRVYQGGSKEQTNGCIRTRGRRRSPNVIVPTLVLRTKTFVYLWCWTHMILTKSMTAAYVETSVSGLPLGPNQGTCVTAADMILHGPTTVVKMLFRCIT